MARTVAIGEQEFEELLKERRNSLRRLLLRR